MQKFKKGLWIYIVILACTFAGVFAATGMIMTSASATEKENASESQAAMLPNPAVRPSETEELPEIPQDEYLEQEEALDDNEENELYEEDLNSEEASEPEDTENPEAAEQPEQKPATKPSEPVDYPYYIRVNRLANCVTVYAKNEEGFYSVPVRAMVCSVGKYDWTPLGVFKTSTKYSWRLLYGDVYGQYAFRIHGAIMFHSVPYQTKSKDDLLYEEYNSLGTPDSLGCIRLSVEDAKWLVENCPSGTITEIYDSEDPGPLGKPVPAHIPEDSDCRTWDPTDPDENNPWFQVPPVFYGSFAQTYEQDTPLDLPTCVSALDYRGRSIGLTVEGTVDTSVPGTYTVVYTATDDKNNTVTQTVVFTILEKKVPEMPTAPETPTDSEKPTTPQKPTEPEQPTQPEQPTNPEKPTQPEQPTDPEKPTQPTDPEKPAQPEQPTESEQPTQPEKPTESEQPTDSEQPTQPENPTDLEPPEAAESAEQPEQPEATDSLETIEAAQPTE